MLSQDLTGKTALVGGSTQGIGLATAQALATLGAQCYLVARNEETLKKAVATLDSSKGQQHGYLVADFQYPEKLREVVSSFAADKTINILINNSGGPAAGPVVDAQTDAFMQAFQQHLICNHILTTALLPGMKQAGYGRVVNVISTSVKIPLKNLGVSNTIRGAVASWAKTWANEVASFGITVNNVLPGA
ncbi:MAG: SDR family NAD(P)-dependent oxidoreductase, partial [Sphingobacteriales bacterium]